MPKELDDSFTQNIDFLFSGLTGPILIMKVAGNISLNFKALEGFSVVHWSLARKVFVVKLT